MNNLSQVWSKRFNHYLTEVQKYMRFVFTGHLAIVLVFVIGAVGYQYSEWLTVVESSFPAEWLVAGIVGFVLSFSRPTTLLKEPDQVYLLPLETKMAFYFKKVLQWTFFSQAGLVAVIYIIGIPLLNEVTELSSTKIWLGLFLVITLKLLNVHVEFNFRYALRGKWVLFDRLIRIIFSILAIQTLLTDNYLLAVIFVLLLFFYNFIWKKSENEQPIPYEHFVKLEQNRMMAFYRFANYFTDVPHLRGGIHRRAWLNFIYTLVPYTKNNTQGYLVFRTFIRTDDHFYLWVRLTAISAIIAAFVNIPAVILIVAAALSFATTIQLKYALLSSKEFRMDLLFPVDSNLRTKAVQKLIRTMVFLQAIVILICSIGQPLFYLPPIVVLLISELTYYLTKNPAKHLY
ncbi:ABC transporter permease [Ureibacillus manganicus]|uniref:Protein EcsB n=1 Tax=Ureibacillus manganicus DSM 26584 TaxID=1384049 RepID=A0A0A3IAY1_9BACL|nr:ABC transporter permease [Ureibacillus manganicus]KGR79973.1 protein EcsB [Ureibacillus manganicus DSM 26584]